jgi:hypothetical protein
MNIDKGRKPVLEQGHHVALKVSVQEFGWGLPTVGRISQGLPRSRE